MPNTNSTGVLKPTFEESYKEIERLVDNRRAGWTYVSILEWKDVRQILLIKTFNKWHLYDPEKSEGRLDRWLNTLITNEMRNLRRDHLLRWSRPCIGGGNANGKSCEYRRGEEGCLYTSSGRQCEECPLYAKWQKTRMHQLHIKSNVPLEHHAQEVNNIQEDFVDIAGIKDSVDQEMLQALTQWEKRVYRLLMIRHLTPNETCAQLEKVAKARKRPLASEEYTSYQGVLEYKRRFKDMMMDILKRNGHL